MQRPEYSVTSEQSNQRSQFRNKALNKIGLGNSSDFAAMVYGHTRLSRTDQIASFDIANVLVALDGTVPYGFSHAIMYDDDSIVALTQLYSSNLDTVVQISRYLQDGSISTEIREIVRPVAIDVIARAYLRFAVEIAAASRVSDVKQRFDFMMLIFTTLTTKDIDEYLIVAVQAKFTEYMAAITAENAPDTILGVLSDKPLLMETLRAYIYIRIIVNIHSGPLQTAWMKLVTS